MKKRKEKEMTNEINFQKSFLEERKKAKTRRIQMAKRKRQQKKLKVILTIEVVMISSIIYNLSGYLGNLAQENIIYQSMLIMLWLWLFLGQFAVLYGIWENEK